MQIFVACIRATILFSVHHLDFYQGALTRNHQHNCVVGDKHSVVSSCQRAVGKSNCKDHVAEDSSASKSGQDRRHACLAKECVVVVDTHGAEVVAKYMNGKETLRQQWRKKNDNTHHPAVMEKAVN